jgi:hypothetical protein
MYVYPIPAKQPLRNFPLGYEADAVFPTPILQLYHLMYPEYSTPRKSEENLPFCCLVLEKTFPSQAPHGDVEILKRLSGVFGRSTRPAERRGDETTLQKYILGESPQ